MPVFSVTLQGEFSRLGRVFVGGLHRTKAAPSNVISSFIVHAQCLFGGLAQHEQEHVDGERMEVAFFFRAAAI